jgi:lipoprotein-anchoring transpeptidase ErfK/SrfK
MPVLARLTAATWGDKMPGRWMYAALLILTATAFAVPAMAESSLSWNQDSLSVRHNSPVAKVEKPDAQAVIARVLQEGNNGELRSKDAPGDVISVLFGAKPQLLPETQALDAMLMQKPDARRFVVQPEFQPQRVPFSGYEPGTIVVDTAARRLYLVETRSRALRYAIAVGREGLEFKGTATIGDKQEWPRWIPTKEMQEREPHKYAQYKDGMPGGPSNPLGARALYLYQGKKDTHIRIHGTNQPETIGTNSSNGCFRMINEHVIDLYRRVRVGTPVVVL